MTMSLKILIVDDEPLMAEEAAFALEMAGYTTQTAGTVDEALGILRSSPEIGVLVSDIRMPHEDGISLATRALAMRGEQDALGVIFITGHGSGPPPPWATACIMKPFSNRAITTAVQAAMMETEARRRAAMDAQAGDA
jgi:DNA-binding NtrC family response regulator